MTSSRKYILSVYHSRRGGSSRKSIGPKMLQPSLLSSSGKQLTDFNSSFENTMIVNIALEIAALCVSTMTLVLVAFNFPKALSSKSISNFNAHDRLIFQLILTAVVIQILVIVNSIISLFGFYLNDNDVSYGLTWRSEWLMSPFIVVSNCGLVLQTWNTNRLPVFKYFQIFKVKHSVQISHTYY